MDIQKLLDQVRSQIGDEAVAKVNSVLKSIESGVTDLQDDIKRVNSESKERKLKIRELESSVQDKDVELEDLKKKADTSEIEKEVDGLREFKSRTLKAQRDSFASKLENVSKHPKFEDIKDFLHLPEPGKDGKYDLSKMEDEDLEKSMDELNKFDKAGLFGKVERPGVDGTPRKEQPDGSKPQEPKSPDEMFAAMDEAFEQY
ncbi:MAG: hypothetical protein U5N56_00105 [Candidatus Marinimicrobia bacterium]|nr:hypothetical protein [Candidatus Neomarinimicrobiota bacterium]